MEVVVAIICSLGLAYGGYKKKSLSLSGAIAGFIVGYITTISSYRFSATLFTFFFTSSFLTKWKSKQKERIEHEHKQGKLSYVLLPTITGGQRNYVQVLSNGGFATALCALFLLLDGVDGSINFRQEYWIAFIQIGILAHYSCTNGDTWASEVGVLDKNQPYHIIYWKQVPAGTNGGVSKLGTIASILGGTTIGIAFYISGLLFTGSYQPLSLILVGSFSGFLGSMLDSLLGATLQYSGWSPKLNKVVNLPSSDSSTIGIGNNILDNHQVNFLSAAMTSIIVPYLVSSYFV